MERRREGRRRDMELLIVAQTRQRSCDEASQWPHGNVSLLRIETAASAGECFRFSTRLWRTRTVCVYKM